MAKDGAVTRAFDRWIELQDENLLRETASPRSWLISTAFVCLFLPVLAYAPGAREFFGLRLVPALICYLPAVLGGILFVRWHGLSKPFGRAAFIWALGVTSAIQFFCASLITWCSARGAAAMPSLFILSAAYYGHVFRVSATEPFLAFGTLVSVSAAALLERNHVRLGLFLFAGVAAITVELLVGINARRWALTQRSNEQLRAALTANILDEQAREMKRLSSTLVDVLAQNHDMNNTLMALRLSADALETQAAQQHVESIGMILGDLRSGIDRLARMAGSIKTAGHPAADAPAPEVIDVADVIEGVLPAVSARFVGVKLALVADRDVPLCSAVRGGVETMRRVIENLLINACEGDGRRNATRVEIKVARDPSGGRLLIVVTDDGPGFSPEQLANGVEVFASTKPQGSGLGLFTCERLVRASDGQLVRANAPGGGARLTVILPLVRAA